MIWAELADTGAGGEQFAASQSPGRTEQDDRGRGRGVERGMMSRRRGHDVSFPQHIRRDPFSVRGMTKGCHIFDTHVATTVQNRQCGSS